MNDGDSGNDFLEMLLGLIDIKPDDNSDDSAEVYRDQPILFRASDLVKNQEEQTERQHESDCPGQLTEMRRISYTPEAQWKSREWLFYKQAKFMEDYEDDYEGDAWFNTYFPTYNDMSLEQQRTYFSWRTKVRLGKYEDTCLSYIFVYAYELINLIGVESPMEGYDRLRSLLEHYKETQPKIKRFFSQWLWDMVIYYGLDSELLADSDRKAADDSIIILRSPNDHSSEDIFAALLAVSSYDAARSAYYRSAPEDFREVTAAVFRALSEYYRKRGINTVERIFGKRKRTLHPMFASAVFCHYRVSKHTEYEIDDLCRYELVGGMWYCDCYPLNKKGNKMTGDMLKAVDSIIREKTGFSKPLQLPEIMKLLYKIIDTETDKYIEYKKQQEKLRIDIDLTKLGGIRRAADITRDKLIVDEEFDDVTDEQEFPEAEEVHPAAGNNDPPLDDGEYAFMQALLYGGDINAAAKSAGTMPSILAESINEKFYDVFADTVIDFEGDTPYIIEDYEEDLKGMILP